MQIIMPKLGLTMTHGTVTEWLKAPGDSVRAEEALCTYETEKVTLELVAPDDGVLVEVLAPAGATVPAGAAVCEFWTRAERRPEEAASREPVGESQETEGVAQSPALHSRPSSGVTVVATPKARALARQHGLDLPAIAGTGPEGRVQAADVLAARKARAFVRGEVRATPLARRMAAETGVDLRSIDGAGPGGMIAREDVERAVRRRAAGTAQPAGEGVGSMAQDPGHGVLPSTAPSASVGAFIPHSVLRRTIADRMSQSAFTAPHVSLMTEAEATNLVSARAQLNQELPAADKISYNALLAALVARALAEHAGVNARWEEDGIRQLAEINIALAVDTERGLVTPVLHEVDKLSLLAVQRGYAELVDRALAGTSLPGDFAGGTFTLTNLGGMEVDGFTPIINPPQAAILGAGRIVEKPVARDGAVVIRPMIVLSLSFDHRIVDGAPAARFLQRVKQLVERPVALLLHPRRTQQEAA